MDLRRPLVVLVLAAALWFGWRMGVAQLRPSETALIDAAAARFAEETGGSVTACFAVPSQARGVRLVVHCAQDWQLSLDPWGRVVGP